MSRAGTLLAPLLLAFAPGCTVVGVSARDDTGLRNSCTQDDDCGQGFSCRTGVCQTLNGTLESLLITASPPTDSFLPHFTYVTQVENVPTGGGSKDIQVPAPAQIVGSLNLPTTISCYPAFRSDEGDLFVASIDRTVPVAVTLGLRQRKLGLSQQVYYARAMTIGRMGYHFNARLPAGEYDVYLATPTQQGETDCVAPPQLYRDFPIGVKKANTEILFRIPVITPLKLVVVWPEPSVELDGWVVDIIEPSGGYPISTQVILPRQPDAAETKRPIEYRVPLAYSTVLVGEALTPDSSGELLRLRPPPARVAPTIYLDRAALSLLTPDPNDDVRLTAFTRFPKNVSVHGQLLRQAGGSSVGGSVTLVSTEIYGVDSGVFASYQTKVEVGAGGLIDINEIPPGKYRVRGEPLLWTGPADGEPLSAAETTWDIPADLPIQFGKVLELPTPSAVTGRSQVPGAQVRATPSLLGWSPFLNAFGQVPLSPRPSSGLVNDAGEFSLRVDPGRFDFTVEAPDGLGFGWYVRPGADVGGRDLDLSAELRRPSVLTGTATIAVQGGTQPLASAAINAYAYLNKDRQYTRDPEQAVSVVQVAAARADEDGAFRLLLPEALVTSGPN